MFDSHASSSAEVICGKGSTGKAAGFWSCADRRYAAEYTHFPIEIRDDGAGVEARLAPFEGGRVEERAR
jgi:hypothetical protein